MHGKARPMALGRLSGIVRAGVILALALAVAGCNLVPFFTANQTANPGSPTDLNITDLGLQVSEGTTKMFGNARLPNLGTGRKTQAIATTPATGAKVEVLDADLRPICIETKCIEATADNDGNFFLDLVPKGKTMVIKVSTTLGDGKTASMRKLARPDAAKECVKVDLASTMVADKIMSPPGKALFKEDLPLQNAPLIELFRPEEVNKLEEKIRKGLTIEDEDKPRIEQILTAPPPTRPPGSGSDALPSTAFFNELVAKAPELKEDYHQLVFERAEAELHFTIKATGIVRKPRKRATISGTFTMTLAGVKAGTKAVEFWMSQATESKQVGAATAANGWTTTVDTFKFTDGEYTMVSILASDNGRKKGLGSVDITIDNSFTNYCGIQP